MDAPDHATLVAKTSVGSAAQTLHKGDFVLIPPNTPHVITEADADLAIAYGHIPATTDWSARALTPASAPDS